ncbi:hypothetical protein ACFU98_12740 [Streptomyces sp. NPDC057575]|uniref:phage terminase small subunit n=1 Tax=unclassified Streptomyces TaxID=2593676 RepID=UPI00367645A3
MIVPDDELRGPELPEGVLGVNTKTGELVEWHPMTLLWWNEWRTSLQAQTFTGTDWSFLVDTALMHHAMWEKGQWTLAAEVRLRAAKFGATPEDRARLKLERSMTPRAPRRGPYRAPGTSQTSTHGERG